MNLPDRRQDRDEIKRALSDPTRIAEILGLTDGMKRQANGVSVRCPLHADDKPSLSLTVSDGGIRVRCFTGCDFGGGNGGGDVLSLIAAVERIDLATDFPAVLARAREIAGMAAPERPRPSPPVDAAAAWARLAPLDADGWEYLRGRGLGDAADLCRTVPSVGGPQELTAVAGGIAVPLRDAAGRIVAIQARNLAAKHDFRVLGKTGEGVFGNPERLADPSVKWLIVVEGLTDFLAATVAIGKSERALVVGVAGVKNATAALALPVRGRRILVATDADPAGDACAAEFIAAYTKAGAVAVRARPEGAKDIADLLAKGVDVRAWLHGAAKVDLGFRNFGARITGERERRLADAGKAIPFGVGYLDAALGGIVPRDVILVGADSGFGKTQLVTIVADAVCGAGKRVHYFALEPEPTEIERRLKFQRVALMAWGRFAGGARRLNFQDWHGGKQDDMTRAFEPEAERQLSERLQGLHTFYRSEKGEDFTPADFDRMARAITDETDLIILDHVHYFDDDDDANRSQKRTSRQIRDLAISTGRPVIVVAHMRKKQAGARKNPRLIPERDDFEGSSHLFKPVKKAVILAPAHGQPRAAPYFWPTYFAVVKNTLDGSRCRYVGLVNFDMRTNEYEGRFDVGELRKNGEEFKFLDAGDVPQWARPS